MILNLALNLVAMTGAAHASEYFYQPPREVSVLTAQASYRQTFFQNDSKDEPNEMVNGLSRSGLKFDYALNDKLSFGVALTYSDLTLQTNGGKSMSGLEPLLLTFRGHEPVTTWSWLYGVDLGVGLDSADVSAIGSATRTVGDGVDGYNNALTLTPTVGIANAMGRSHHGLLARYDIFKLDSEGDTYLSNGTKQDVTYKRFNRSSLVAFYELHYEGFLIGADLNWIKQWEGQYKIKGPNQTAPHGEDINSGYAFLHADLYANIATSKNAAILPTLTWNTTALWSSHNNIDDFRATIAYRQAL